jgi:hypothetical protein
METAMTQLGFDEQWRQLCSGRSIGRFDYGPSDGPPREVVRRHFRDSHEAQLCGVYVVRRLDNTAVLYVGKAGTITSDGELKDQDLRGRLTNTRGNESSQAWFTALCSENGAVSVEYVLLESTPVSPSLAEAMLLQAFLNETGRLPCRNRCL